MADRIGWRCRAGVSGAQLLAFAELLPQAYAGGHAGGVFGTMALVPDAIIPSLFAPYFYGPLWAAGMELEPVWDNLGGYIDIVMLVVAVYGLLCRRSSLSWLLAGWVVVAIAKTFGVQPVATWLNFVPGMSATQFFRYAQPTWEFAIYLLAALGVNFLHRSKVFRYPPVVASGITLLTGMLPFIYGFNLWLPRLNGIAGVDHWARGSVIWASMTGLLAVLLLAQPLRQLGAYALAALLVVDTTAMYVIPSLSNPRRGEIDWSAIWFLQANLGLQRFFTLGPVQPNYGAYFGISSINHAYLPVALRWVR